MKAIQYIPRANLLKKGNIMKKKAVLDFNLELSWNERCSTCKYMERINTKVVCRCKKSEGYLRVILKPSETRCILFKYKY